MQTGAKKHQPSAVTPTTERTPTIVEDALDACGQADEELIRARGYYAACVRQHRAALAALQSAFAAKRVAKSKRRAARKAAMNAVAAKRAAAATTPKN